MTFKDSVLSLTPSYILFLVAKSLLIPPPLSIYGCALIFVGLIRGIPIPQHKRFDDGTPGDMTGSDWHTTDITFIVIVIPYVFHLPNPSILPQYCCLSVSLSYDFSASFLWHPYTKRLPISFGMAQQCRPLCKDIAKRYVCNTSCIWLEFLSRWLCYGSCVEYHDLLMCSHRHSSHLTVFAEIHMP